MPKRKMRTLPFLMLSASVFVTLTGSDRAQAQYIPLHNVPTNVASAPTPVAPYFSPPTNSYPSTDAFNAPTPQQHAQPDAPAVDNVYLNASALQLPPPPAPISDSCDVACADGQCDPFGTWQDNTQVWFGGEAFKTIGDQLGVGGFSFGSFSFAAASVGGVRDGTMNSAGLVGGLNSAYTLVTGSPIRGQIGVSYGLYDLEGRSTGSQRSSEHQIFTTVGVSKRSDILNDDPFSWGLVYDTLAAFEWGAYARSGSLSQVRGLAGWAFSPSNELGFWGAFSVDSTLRQTFSSFVRSMNQYNLFWRHNYGFGGQSMLWVGGSDLTDVGSWLVGTLGQAPLNDRLSLYGNFTFAFSGDSAGRTGSIDQEWAFGFGLVYSFGGKAVSPSVSGPQGLPLIPVANNGSLLAAN